MKELRLRHRLTQTELAAPAYTAAYVSTIEAGRRQPSRTALEHFASRLGVDPEQLLTGRSPEQRSALLARYLEARRTLASGDSGAISKSNKELESIARESKRVDLVELQAKAIFAIGLAHELSGELETALQKYAQAETLLEKESPLLRVEVVAAKARVLQTTGDIAYAVFLLERALAELKDAKLDDPSALVRLHSSLVAAYFEKGLIPQASESAEIALELALEVSDPERLANMNLNVGILLAEQKHWDEAERHFAEAERWFEQLSYRSDLTKVQLARSIYLRDQEQWDQARTYARRARETFQQAGQSLNESRAIGVLAMTERLSGNAEEAKFLLRQSISLAGDDKATIGIAYRELGLCEATQDRSKALQHLRQAVEILEGAGDALDLAIAYRELGNLLSEKEELKEACDAYRTAADLFEAA
ncbi:MAG: tetratricopeptide repeat protein [Actinomycetota bacterium]